MKEKEKLNKEIEDFFEGITLDIIDKAIEMAAKVETESEKKDILKDFFTHFTNMIKTTVVMTQAFIDTSFEPLYKSRS